MLGCLAEGAPLSPEERKNILHGLKRKSPTTFASTSKGLLTSVKRSEIVAELGKFPAASFAVSISENAVSGDLESEAQVYLLH